MYIREWEWDRHNIKHIARHGLGARDVLQVWRGAPKFRRNRKRRAATYQMVGPDDGGRIIAAFIVEVAERPGAWRVVTARAATAAEVDWWRR